MSETPATDDLARLYREAILANAAEPCGFEVDIQATHQAEGSNLLCGDVVVLQLRVVKGVIEAAAFQGESCAICTASASLLCRHLPGQAVEALSEAREGFELAVDADADDDCPAYLHPMLGVRRYPARVACAVLPWRTAEQAVRQPFA